MEWEQASEGRRQLTWSTGRRDLRKLAGLGADVTDEDIAAEDLDADTRLGLSADAWNFVDRAHLAPALLAVAETGGLDAARAWLAARELDWVDNPPSPQRASNYHEDVGS